MVFTIKFSSVYILCCTSTLYVLLGRNHYLLYVMFIFVTFIGLKWFVGLSEAIRSTTGKDNVIPIRCQERWRIIKSLDLIRYLVGWVVIKFWKVLIYLSLKAVCKVNLHVRFGKRYFNNIDFIHNVFVHVRQMVRPVTEYPVIFKIIFLENCLL